MSGEMRRPPQLWEQRLARTTSVLAAGVGGGEATAIVAPSPPPGDGGGVEPAPVTPPPGDFIAPSQPTLIGSVQGINVVWNGLNSAGDLWPSDTSYVEVHMDTSGTATLGTATLKGRLARPGGLAVTGLSAGTTYYFRLRGADPTGNVTAASTAASGQPGLINAPDIAANAITANSIVAGTITGWDINAAYVSGGTVSGGFISGGTVSGGFITGGTVDGSRIQTGSTGSRVVFNDSQGGVASLSFYNSSNVVVSYMQPAASNLLMSGNLVSLSNLRGDSVTADNLAKSGQLEVTGSDVDMAGVHSNNTTGIDTVGITGSPNFRLRRISSSQEIKYDITPLSGSLSDSVDEDRLSDVATVDPSTVLDLAVTEFSIIDGGEPTDRRVLGFIADDVADKLPVAVTRYEDGRPAGVLDTSVLAALVAVVQDQAATINDLRSRIEALEA
jgi:hypothetical protein